KRYTSEFKAQAVELLSTGKPVPGCRRTLHQQQPALPLAAGLAGNAGRERRPTSRRRAGRCGRPAFPAARKRPPQDGERHFKKSRGHIGHQTPTQLREMIGEIHDSTRYGIRPICAVLGVPRSSYYHAARPTPTQRADEQLGDMIQAIFHRHRRRYGYRRIWEELADQGIVCAAERVRRIMRERGLRAIQPGTYLPRTSDGRADKPSANLLLDQPLPEKPNQV